MKPISELTKAARQSLSLPSRDQPPSVDSKHFNTINCRSCNKSWQSENRSPPAGNYSSECGDCSRTRRIDKFSKICPPLYQATEVGRLPQRQLGLAMAWQYGPRGLILLGETGV